MEDATRDEFLVRFYKWAIEDARTELLAGFPLLGTIQGSQALGFRSTVDSFPERQRWGLVRARVKRGHERAVGICGESFSEAELELERRCHAQFGNVSSPLREMFHIEQDMAGPASRFDKRRLVALIRERLSPICGETSVKFSRYHWGHSILCAGWRIYTEIEVRDSSSSFQLTYHHDIEAPMDELARVGQNISFMLWMGIFPTEWNLLKRGDEEKAASALYGLCSHFMQAAPDLLEGLHP
jgi:hypothetical protein